MRIAISDDNLSYLSNMVSINDDKGQRQENI